MEQIKDLIKMTMRWGSSELRTLRVKVQKGVGVGTSQRQFLTCTSYLTRWKLNQSTSHLITKHSKPHRELGKDKIMAHSP